MGIPDPPDGAGADPVEPAAPVTGATAPGLSDATTIDSLIVALAKSPPVRGATMGELLAGRYRVGAKLGRGGMGEVYAVRDLELDEDIALKLLRPELSSDADYRRRLRSEVRLARRVSHPNVCRVHDLGQHGEQLFVTMARVPGVSLRERLRAIRAGAEPGLPLPAVVDLLGQLCAALTAAHRAGVLHKDVKPDNILVDDGRLVLTDFGIASLAGDFDPPTVAGTPSYVAPEVARGEPCDVRADVYAAAVVAYELLAGRRPFTIPSMREAELRGADPGPPPPLPEPAAPAPIREALDRVLAAGMAPRPDDRIGTAAELAERLAAALRPVEGAPAPRPLATVAAPRRRAEARIVTVLAFHADAGPFASTGRTDSERTGPGSAVEHGERIILDLGGWPLASGPGGWTALFGAPVALGDDAARAVRAAAALAAEHRAGRAGLDTVRAMIRPGGEPAGLELGRLADALAAAAGPGELWLSPAAARQVAAHVEVEPVRDVGGQRALRVTGPAPAAARATVARPGELARLEAAARACFESRTARVVEVRGAPGTGKTHLRAAFTERIAARRDVAWLCAAAAPLGAAAPWSLLRSADADWHDSTVRAAGDRAAALTAGRQAIEARAAVRPVVVVFDDMQWADEASRAMVAHLATHLVDVPVLLLVCGRDPQDLPGAEVIELGPLDDAAALALAREAAPTLGDDELTAIVGRASGNPYFLVELARAPRDRAGDEPLPLTVEAAIQARLDRLSAEAAELLSAAAVVGRAFWREAARAALPTPVDDAVLDAGLVELERRGLVFPTPPTGLDDERYQFAQALVREVAYARVPARDRRRAHAAVAAWLADELDRGHTLPTPSPATPVERALDPDLLWALAHHRELGGDAAAAAASWRTAGLRSLESFAYAQAYQALRRARDLGGDTADPVLAERLGEAAYHAHTLDVAESAYADALAHTADADAAARARLWFRLGQVASARADQERALDCYQRGLALVARDGQLTAEARRDPRQAALLFGWWGWVRTYQRGADDAEGLAACERAVELLDGTSHRRELGQALSRLGGAYMRAGRWDAQLRANQRNLDLAHELGDLQLQITAHINLGFVLGNLGELDRAIAHTEQAVALSRRTGARATAGLALSNLAGYLLERGDLAASEARLAEGLRLLEQTGQRRVLPETHQFAARRHARAGDLAAARAAVMIAIGMARADDARAELGVGLRILAQLEARAGDPAAAAAALDEAAALLADADAFERARLDAARARVVAAAGRPDQAAAARAAAAAVYAQLGARVDLAALDDPDDVR